MFHPAGGRLLVLQLLRKVELEAQDNPDLSASLRARLVRRSAPRSPPPAQPRRRSPEPLTTRTPPASRRAQSSSAKAVFDITWPAPKAEASAAPAPRGGDGPASPPTSPRPGSIRPSDFRDVKYRGDWMRRPVGDNEVRAPPTCHLFPFCVVAIFAVGVYGRMRRREEREGKV